MGADVDRLLRQRRRPGDRQLAGMERAAEQRIGQVLALQARQPALNESVHLPQPGGPVGDPLRDSAGRAAAGSACVTPPRCPAMTSRSSSVPRGCDDLAVSGDVELLGGRERRTIVIVPYDASWPDAFARERKRISDALAALAHRI